MRYIIVTIFSISLFFVFYSSSAQNADSLKYYRGFVVSYPEKNPVAFAHVINYTQKWGVVSDSLGYFEIWGKPGDTLNISAIGFQYHDSYALGNFFDTLIQIELNHRAYEIPEASISYLGPYQQFKQKVIHLDLPKIEFNPQIEAIFNHVDRAPLASVPSISSPASLIYVMFSKEVKEVKKYLELKEDKKVDDKVYDKINKYIVQNLTGLNLIESEKFLKHCDFQDKYIINTPKYQIYSRVLEKYKDYKKTHIDSLNIN